MKFIFLLINLSLACSVFAQLSITAGTGIFVSGNMPITLHNSSFINKGNFIANNGRLIFSGNISSTISGTRPIQLYELELNKTANSSVLLEKSIDVQHRIVFTAGLLDLNGYDVALQNTALLEGENENSRITGQKGGQIISNSILNSPAAANPGNLGLIISSPQNLGAVQIKRGHQSQQTGTGHSILRYYDISAANNNNLNATLKFTWADAELNGLTENSLQLFKSDDATNWTALQSTAPDAVNNSIEKTGIQSFSRFTVSAKSIPLTKSDFTLSPNPFREETIIHIVSANNSAAIVKVFDSKGSLVKVLTTTITQGSNQVRLDCVSLQGGVYSFHVVWNNGQMKRVVQAIKLQ